MPDSHLLDDQPIAWTPTPDVIERAQLTKFMRQVGVSTWEELYEFSIRDVEKFTEEVLKFLDIRFDPPYEKLLDTSDGIEFPNWFTSAKSPQRRGDAEHQEAETRPVGSVSETVHAGLNITEMCLDRWQTDEMKDQMAVIAETEGGEVWEYSYETLFESVTECAQALRLLGLGKGDAVGIHLPMIVETVVALLAINRIGAIAIPVFSGYGVEAIASRMNAVAAKAIFTCDVFFRRSKFVKAAETTLEAVKSVPTIEHVISVRSDLTISTKLDDSKERHDYEPFLATGHNYLLKHSSDLGAEPTAAEDPLIILYTSGTTGKPKGIAHTHASFPIKAAQDMAFGTDVGRGTRICWYTDIGWMMGPWLIYGALINGATICIYDGAPDYPTPDRMWEFCARHKVEVLGISPTLIRALAASETTTDSPPYEGGVAPASGDGVVLSSIEDDEKANRSTKNHPVPTKDVGPPLLRKEGSYLAPFVRHDLSSLRIFASTGEPWNPDPWWWLFEKVGNSKLPIINYSGGTEIAGGILMGNPLLPIKPCSFPGPCPGMDVDILDEDGNPVPPGQVGELVIKQPWVGMARGFWKERERYLETYWRRFKDIWVHGDWAMRDKDGHWFILGRSDDTLKVAGKRVGPAEVESILVSHPAVMEAAVIGVPDEAKGTAMVAFVVTGDEGQVTSEVESADSSLVNRHWSLQQELKVLVARDMGKPLAPSRIHFVSALPKTRNAKVMRRVIRAAYLGEDAGDLSALENPTVVDEIKHAGMS